MSKNNNSTGGDARKHKGQVLFEFVRHWSRRSTASADRLAEQNGRYALVIEAVDSIYRREPATINSIAAEIGIDQSGASRLVKDATIAGYLELKPSVSDARKKSVTVSVSGIKLLAKARAWQEDVFLELTADWSDEERSAFYRAMLSLLNRSREIGK
jgi:DNA-binding MarR family transcriptional regulator